MSNWRRYIAIKITLLQELTQNIYLKFPQEECGFTLDKWTMIEQSAPDFARVYENVIAYDCRDNSNN